MKVEYYMKIRKQYLQPTWVRGKRVPLKNLDTKKMLCYYDFIFIKTEGENINYYNLYKKLFINKTFATTSSEGVTIEQEIKNGITIKIDQGVDLKMLLSTDLVVRKMAYRTLRQNFKEQINK